MIKDIELKLKERAPGVIGDHKFFSVIIPLVERAEELEMLFEVRASHLNTQPGDVCFPGGHMEEGETPLECALREMEEELGISSEDVEILGQFDTLYGFSGYTLYTFVAKISLQAFESMRKNSDEVEEVFAVPVSFFLNEEPIVYSLDVVSDTEDFPFEEVGIPRRYNWRKGKNVLPIYHYHTRVIWGMTARIVHWFTKEIVR